MSQCPYCGQNQVPHFIFWYNESLTILLSPLRRKILYNFFSKFIVQKGWGQKIALAFLFIGEALKIISRQSDVSKCKVRRAQVVWVEAQRQGLNMQELLLFGKGFDCYVISKSENQLIGLLVNEFVFSGLPRPIGYYNPKLDAIDDKAWFKQEMQKNNLPVPVGGAVTSFNQAKKIFLDIKKFGNYAIVKPRSGSRGRHSTTFVSSEAELESAFKIAKQLCYWVVVEQQLFGPVYRATVINFKLEGVLRGDSPQIVGDGVKNIQELILQKNSQKPTGVKDIQTTKTLEQFLERQNYKLTSVPKNGEVVTLSEKIGVNYGGSSSEDFEICHPDNKVLFEQAAKILGDPILGFDFIIPDITKSWKSQPCGFLEVNTLPFINLHHDPLHGQPRNVAAKVLGLVIKD